MNVCRICQGDGVIQLAGQWYCIDRDHLLEGFATAGGIVYSMLWGQHDPDILAQKQDELTEVMTDG